jgi:hypothetical protein
MQIVDSALMLAARHWQVIPLNGKIPATKHGVKDATTDPDKIRQMFGTRPHNIGARVPRNLIVLDKDPRNGGSWEALEALAGAGLPATFTVATGNPDGEHRYYIRPEGNLTGRKLPPGIDLKTDNGYCVMPPSIHPDTGKQYEVTNWQRPEELPAAIVALLTEPKPIVQLEHPRRTPTTRRLGILVHGVRWAPEGTRNNQLFFALCQSLRDGYTDADRQLIHEAALAAGLTLDEVQRVDANARAAEPGVTT